MSENKTLNWIQELAQQTTRQEAESLEREQSAIIASLIIQNGMPEFMRQLKMELTETCEQLCRTPELKIWASISDTTDPELETRFRIDIKRMGIQPDSTYTDIFHHVSQHVVRCQPLDEKQIRLQFAMQPNKMSVGLYAEKEPLLLMTPAGAARYIIQPMVDKVRR